MAVFHWEGVHHSGGGGGEWDSKSQGSGRLACALHGSRR